MAAPPWELADDVIADILLRLPPDEPKWLFRAALTCKPWLRTITDPAFLHRYRAFHGAAPLLGLIDRDPLVDRVPRFVATTAVPAFSFPIPVFDAVSAWGTVSACPLDCRHGRALIRTVENGCDHYLVCDPVTGDRRRRVPRSDVGTQCLIHDAAAIFCAVAGCRHLDCHGGPFCVVFMFRNWLLARTMSATVYSSETGAWSAPAALEGVLALEGIHDNKAYGRGALIGDEIFFMLSGNAGISKYDWRRNCLSVVNPPPSAAYKGGVTLMVMEDSSLGLAGIEHTSLHLWSRMESSEESAEWVQCRVLDLEKMMPMANPRDRAQVVGFAEGVDVIFITTGVGLFMMGLKSGRVKRIGKPRRNMSVLPYMSFYTPDRCRLSSLGGPVEL